MVDCDRKLSNHPKDRHKYPREGKEKKQNKWLLYSYDWNLIYLSPLSLDIPQYASLLSIRQAPIAAPSLFPLPRCQHVHQ